jgi:dTDP-4-amino-4,6-dideoxygalactose transaminase
MRPSQPDPDGTLMTRIEHMDADELRTGHTLSSPDQRASAPVSAHQRSIQMSDRKPINVTKAFVPPLEEYTEQLQRVWASGQLTNQGALAVELERILAERLDVPYCLFMANGTLAIQLAIRALGVKGKVITTPYSYVATLSSILWEHCEPVFVDIDPTTTCIDANVVERALEDGASAILATHVYGLPCDVERLAELGKRYGAKVIYDAAHAFGATYKGKSLLAYGDMATCSFHATKLFHTGEGGCVIAHNEKDAAQLRLLRSFGHIGDEHFQLGINAKASELNAAMGLTVLPHVERLMRERGQVVEQYDAALASSPITRPKAPEGWVTNHAYYPMIFRSGEAMQRVKAALEAEQVFPRRYFYPSLDTLPYVEADACPVSRSIAERVLCLPLYPGLAEGDVERIAQTVVRSA